MIYAEKKRLTVASLSVRMPSKKCSRPGCTNLAEKHCVRCGKPYCCRACQKDDWRRHSDTCKASPPVKDSAGSAAGSTRRKASPPVKDGAGSAAEEECSQCFDRVEQQMWEIVSGSGESCTFEEDYIRELKLSSDLCARELTATVNLVKQGEMGLGLSARLKIDPGQIITVYLPDAVGYCGYAFPLIDIPFTISPDRSVRITKNLKIYGRDTDGLSPTEAGVLANDSSWEGDVVNRPCAGNIKSLVDLAEVYHHLIAYCGNYGRQNARIDCCPYGPSFVVVVRAIRRIEVGEFISLFYGAEYWVGGKGKTKDVFTLVREGIAKFVEHGKSDEMLEKLAEAERIIS